MTDDELTQAYVDDTYIYKCALVCVKVYIIVFVLVVLHKFTSTMNYRIQLLCTYIRGQQLIDLSASTERLMSDAQIDFVIPYITPKSL